MRIAVVGTGMVGSSGSETWWRGETYRRIYRAESAAAKALGQDYLAGTRPGDVSEVCQ